jgi:hypothetical protein
MRRLRRQQNAAAITPTTSNRALEGSGTDTKPPGKTPLPESDVREASSAIVPFPEFNIATKA